MADCSGALCTVNVSEKLTRALLASGPASKRHLQASESKKRERPEATQMEEGRLSVTCDT